VQSGAHTSLPPKLTQSPPVAQSDCFLQATHWLVVGSVQVSPWLQSVPVSQQSAGELQKPPGGLQVHTWLTQLLESQSPSLKHGPPLAAVWHRPPWQLWLQQSESTLHVPLPPGSQGMQISPSSPKLQMPEQQSAAAAQLAPLPKQLPPPVLPPAPPELPPQPTRPQPPLSPRPPVLPPPVLLELAPELPWQPRRPQPPEVPLLPCVPVEPPCEPPVEPPGAATQVPVMSATMEQQSLPSPLTERLPSGVQLTPEETVTLHAASAAAQAYASLLTGRGNYHPKWRRATQAIDGLYTTSSSRTARNLAVSTAARLQQR
jgi:hypothetical protein